MLGKNEAISTLNKLGKEGIPFSFYCDFLGEHWCVAKVSEKANFQFEINHEINNNSKSIGDGGRYEEDRKKRVKKEPVRFDKFPIEFPTFKKAFDQVLHEISLGNSFLTNLTFQTPIKTNLTLEEIFESSKARYKLLVPNSFVVFSPEPFVMLKEDFIYSYPMKGTIDAAIPNAKQLILDDVKEQAEHVTIVDLIRNDLSQVANDVHLTKFRFIDEVPTHDKTLLQVSSEIKGHLPGNWRSHLGTILSKLLPAGSISGAPKPETLRIIQRVEAYQRGFYTGICGHFDGASLDTGVMIRFIKNENGLRYYCSGGGITSFSESEKEYQEMIDKVYLPI